MSYRTVERTALIVFVLAMFVMIAVHTGGVVRAVRASVQDRIATLP